MKYKLLFLITLLAASCSNETAENPDIGDSPLAIGEISTRTDGVTEWIWQENDQLTVSTNTLTAVYTRTAAGKWTSGSSTFTKEALGIVAANGISLAFGTEGLTSTQTSAATYRLADRLTGTGSLDFLTINGTVEHQYIDLVITITEGDGWSTGQFTQTLTAASLALNTSNSVSTTVAAYHPEAATFRAIIPPANLPRGTKVSLGTLTMSSGSETPYFLQGKSALITYTNNSTDGDLKGKRLNLSVKMDLMLSDISITGITIEDFTYVDIPDEFNP